MKPAQFANFDLIINQLTNRVLTYSAPVATETWQGGDTHVPTYEERYVTFAVDLMGNSDLVHWRKDIQPNLPWADDHFEERVCGQPINPGKEWANWPWGNSAEGHLTEEDNQFNHNYMERYWPKYAGPPTHAMIHPNPRYTPEEWASWRPRQGIRYPYGDLNDIVGHLVKYPLSRAAVLPVYHPEDVSVESRRKPCSIDYHFMMRNGRCDIRYTLRSCDVVRHFRDDIYLTVRLLLWVIAECAKQSSVWREVVPGNFVMMIDSLHAFDHDVRPHRS